MDFEELKNYLETTPKEKYKDLKRAAYYFASLNLQDNLNPKLISKINEYIEKECTPIEEVIFRTTVIMPNDLEVILKIKDNSLNKGLNKDFNALAVSVKYFEYSYGGLEELVTDSDVITEIPNIINDKEKYKSFCKRNYPNIVPQKK